MSDRPTDLEEVPLTNWFDSESDFPEISSVNTTPNQGVKLRVPPLLTPTMIGPWKTRIAVQWIQPKLRAIQREVPLEEMGPHTRGDLLDTPNHRVYSPSKQVPVTFVVPPWLGHG